MLAALTFALPLLAAATAQAAQLSLAASRVIVTTADGSRSLSEGYAGHLSVERMSANLYVDKFVSEKATEQRRRGRAEGYAETHLPSH